MGPKWTAEEDAKLSFDWGVFRVETIARKLGRPRGGVVERAKRLQLGSPARGTVTVVGLSGKTGYGKTQIKNAARQLGITIGRRVTLNRAKRGGARHTAIDEEDAERIVDFLKGRPDGTRIRAEHKGAWNELGRGGHRKPPACVACGTNERPHYAKDLCRGCYEKMSRKKNRPGAGPGC